jgi:hypothetical protein
VPKQPGDFSPAYDVLRTADNAPKGAGWLLDAKHHGTGDELHFDEPVAPNAESMI